MNILFIAGPGRSGTTALANYLNQHPEIMVCRERYKYIPKKVTPEHFSFERILDYREDETNLPREQGLELLSTKAPEKLKWVGDKVPGYVRNLKTLQRNNLGARFMVLYRSIEEVAESYQARSKNPSDRWLGNRDGFKIGVRDWNVAMRKTRDFIESQLDPQVLVVSYHDFFHHSEAFIPLISRFLDIEFDDSVRESWRKMSRRFEERRRQKEPLDEEQQAYIEGNKDRVAEAWILERIERQWKEPEVLFGGGWDRALGDGAQKNSPAKTGKDYRKTAGLSTKQHGQNPQAGERRIERLKEQLFEERQRSQQLKKLNQRQAKKLRELRQQAIFVKNSTLRRVLRRLLLLGNVGSTE